MKKIIKFAHVYDAYKIDRIICLSRVVEFYHHILFAIALNLRAHFVKRYNNIIYRTLCAQPIELMSVKYNIFKADIYLLLEVCTQKG